MIEYIAISYLFMFFLCGWMVANNLDTPKNSFKFWVISPVSFPLTVIYLFVRW
jgi:hypothetical protein